MTADRTGREWKAIRMRVAHLASCCGNLARWRTDRSYGNRV